MAVWRVGLKWAINAASVSVLLPLLVTAVAVVVEPLPPVLDARQLGLGMAVEDRAGQRLVQLRNTDFLYAHPLRLAEIPARLQAAVIAAEDARFFRHRGVDPLAIGRALWQLATRRHVVSGASTITQQLARTSFKRPRTLYGKWREMVVALRMESTLAKAEILEGYLNHVPFGPTTRGIAAASEDYFGKPLGSLSVAEVATLAALPKAPVLYHPRQATSRLLKRRNWIIERMVALGVLEFEASKAASREPITVRENAAPRTALHLSRALGQGRFDGGQLRLTTASRVRTTLDRQLQARIEKLLVDAKDDLSEFGATAAAVVVLDNQRSELLAYAGSIDFFDPKSLGQNDGCLALRQPGSTLKPFLYAAAIDWLGMGPATALYDVETTFHGPGGAFAPRNYDGRFHGLVLLREALGSSLNVPAVALAERVGLERWLSMLHDLGFRSLSRPAADYGLALALGDGEVRLVELAEAYATLGRQGWHLPLRIVESWTDPTGERHDVPIGAGQRVVSEAAAIQILEILSDDQARAPGFGRHGVLEMGFGAATKTGTSSNHRDNWAVGVTHEVTVAVWVGNFDGRALRHGSSGIVGAAPLMRRSLQAAMIGRAPAPLFAPERLQSRRICKNSGQLPGTDCPEIVEIQAIGPGSGSGICALHRRVRVDPHNGLLAGTTCRDAVERIFEYYPDALVGWARSAGRPTPPVDPSPRCPDSDAGAIAPRISLRTPMSAAKYLLDPQLSLAQQRLAFAVQTAPETAWVNYTVDSTSSGRIPPPFQWFWPLRAGRHQVTVTSSQGASDSVEFSVR